MEKASKWCERIIEKGLWVLLFIVPLAMGSSARTGFLLSKVLITQGILLILLLVWIIKMILEKEVRLVRTPLDLPILLLFFFSLLSLINARHFAAGLQELFTLLTYILLFYLIVNNLRTPKQVERIFIPVFLAAAFVSIEGILENWGLGVLVTRGERPPEIFSFLGNPNYIAQYLITVLPLSIILSVFANSKVKKTLSALVSAILIFCLFLIFSRGAWLGFLVSLMFLGFILPLPKLKLRISAKWVIPLLLIVVLLVSYFVLTTQQFQQELFRRIPARIINWKTALLMIRAHPILGSGIGNLYFVLPRYLLPQFHEILPMQRIAESHNDYLHIWAETGIFGLLAFLWLIIAYFRRGFQRLKSETGYQRALMAAFLAAALATLVQSFFSFNLHRPVSNLMFWTILALTIVSQEKAPLVSRRKSSYSIVVSLAVLFAILFYACSIKPFRADVYYQKGRRYTQQQEWDKGSILFKKAIEIDPKNPQIHYALGNAYGKSKEYDKAIVEYREALAIDPYHIYARTNLGIVFHLIGKDLRAEGELKKAIALHPFYGEPHFYLGQIYEKRGNVGGAKGKYREAERAHLKYGQALLSWGQPPKAAWEFRKVLILNPESEEARKGLERASSSK